MSPLSEGEEITNPGLKIMHRVTRPLVVITSAITLVSALASLTDAEASSIVGTFADGYELGK
jgi:hypothetical protein